MPTDSEIRRRLPLRPDFRLATSDDWRTLLRTRAHVLVTGPQPALAAFTGAARPEMIEPIGSVASALPLFVAARTLILTEVDALDKAGQRRLIRWMNDPRNANTQIVSLASARLFPLVEAGAFDADLYYRLNTIYFEILDASPRLH